MRAPATPGPIMVRARITRDEWEALRIEAIRQNTAPADLIAHALRKTYDLSGTQKGESK